MQETGSTNAETERRESDSPAEIAPEAGAAHPLPVRSPPAAASIPFRPFLFSFGVLCALLGAAGVVLPLLPTTPLVLLAAACFARSSPRAHRALLENRLLGPFIAEWQRERTVPRRAKATAIVLVIVAFTVSLALLRDAVVTALLVPLGLALVVFLVRLPASRRG